MNMQLIKAMGELGGVGGLAIGGLVLVFQDVLRKKIFPTLRPEAGFRMLRLIVVLTWSVGALGILAWAYVQVNEKNANGGNITQTTSGPGSPAIAHVNGDVNYNYSGVDKGPSSK
jgi:hypothetical protein